MSWPPSKQEWYEILRYLPLDADHAAVRTAVEAAVLVWGDSIDRDRAHLDLWKHLENMGGLQNFQKFLDLVDQVSKFPPDPNTKALIDTFDQLHQSYTIAEIEAAVYLPTNRYEQFLASISLAWTGPGKGKLSKSATGPFVNFMYEITRRVRPDPLEGPGVKEFVKRELDRRAALEIVKGIWNMHGQGAVKSAAFLTDASGQRKSD